MSVNPQQSGSGLRPECLSFPEVLAQPVGTIAPTTMPALTLPLVFASAGQGTWLAFLFATIGVVLVSLNINQFARRSASPGSLYAYIAKGLNPITGFISGWALVPGYLFAAMAILVGFAIYTNLVLGAFGLHASPILLYAVCVAVVWFYAYTDIQLSSVIMLVFELTSIGFILLLSAIVLFTHGFKIDTSQILLQGVSFEGVRLGLVLAVFSFIGSESATVLGDEAKQPLRFIPNAGVWSTVLSGLFFIIVSYTEVLGFSGYKTPLDKSNYPLSVLAELSGVSWLGILLSVGVVCSCLTCILACINAGSRIFFAMARHRIFHTTIGRTHRRNETPYVAVTLSTLAVFLVPATMTLFGIEPSDIYGYTGSISSYAFLMTYILISVAAPVYLYRMEKLRSRHIVIAVLAVLFMLVPVIGSVYPVPPAPYNIFPYLFLGYLAVGGWWFWILGHRSPQVIKDIERDLEAVHKKFSGPKVG